MSSNAGGLILWPAKLLVPVGFVLLALQGISELIKRIAFLPGVVPIRRASRCRREREKALAEEILQRAR